MSATTTGVGNHLRTNRPVPGVYRDVPESVYHGVWDIASSTRLRKLMESSPRHMRYALTRSKPTSAMKVGSLVHAMVLTPPVVDQCYIKAPDVDRRTKEGKATWAEFVASAEGRTVITADEWAMAVRALEAVRASVAATALLDACEERELSVVQEIEKCLVKVRVDAYGLAVGAIDVKTTSDLATREQFERAIGNMGYGFQASLYRMVCREAGLRCNDFSFIVVETTKDDEDNQPSQHTEARVFRLRDDVMDAYEPEVRDALVSYAVCERSGRWDGYEDTIDDVALPPWIAARMGLRGGA